MNKENIDLRTNVIRKTFNDQRPIKCLTPKKIREVDEDIYPGGDIFTTEDGEFIDLEFQMTDFDENELVKYVEFAEALYEKHRKHIHIYIICPNNIYVCVKECKIVSEAEFTIKLACIEEDPCEIIFKMITRKIENGEPLTPDDIMALEMLPVKCNPKMRNFYRREYIRIMNRVL